jgi:hypothetical protein
MGAPGIVADALWSVSSAIVVKKSYFVTFSAGLVEATGFLADFLIFLVTTFFVATGFLVLAAGAGLAAGLDAVSAAKAGTVEAAIIAAIISDVIFDIL